MYGHVHRHERVHAHAWYTRLYTNQWHTSVHALVCTDRDMRVDMCIGMSIDMCIYKRRSVCMDAFTGVCTDAYTYAGTHNGPGKSRHSIRHLLLDQCLLVEQCVRTWNSGQDLVD